MLYEWMEEDGSEGHREPLQAQEKSYAEVSPTAYTGRRGSGEAKEEM